MFISLAELAAMKEEDLNKMMEERRIERERCEREHKAYMETVIGRGMKTSYDRQFDL